MSLCFHPAGLPTLSSERLEVTHLSLVDPRAVLDFYLRNREHLAPTSPALPDDFYTPEFWVRMVECALQEFVGDTAVRLAGTLRGQREVVVTVNFTAIARGPFQACLLGYNTDGEHAGRGLMTEALRTAIGYMFGEQGLHRIMANHLPDNHASAAVLRKLGFVVEGYARDYLQIDGAWRDHVLNALCNPNWVGLCA